MENLEKYKDTIFKGGHFPDAPYNNQVKISFTPEMINEYIPTIEDVMKNDPRGFRLLLISMASHEGFKKGSRSYRTHNPGNIGNTDSGANKEITSLKDGILLQKSYVERIVNGQNKTYPMGQKVVLKPYYSAEIAANVATYGLRPWVPGYEFIFTGQLDQFVKIYSTGARAGNGYVNTIISFFKNHQIDITAESTLQDIIKIA